MYHCGGWVTWYCIFCFSGDWSFHNIWRKASPRCCFRLSFLYHLFCRKASDILDQGITAIVWHLCVPYSAAYAAFTHGFIGKWTYTSLIFNLSLEKIITLKFLPCLTGQPSFSDTEWNLVCSPQPDWEVLELLIQLAFSASVYCLCWGNHPISPPHFVTILHLSCWDFVFSDWSKMCSTEYSSSVCFWLP